MLTGIILGLFSKAVQKVFCPSRLPNLACLNLSKNSREIIVSPSTITIHYVLYQVNGIILIKLKVILWRGKIDSSFALLFKN